MLSLIMSEQLEEGDLQVRRGRWHPDAHRNLHSHLQPNPDRPEANNSPASFLLVQMEEGGTSPAPPSRKVEPRQTLDWVVFIILNLSPEPSDQIKVRDTDRPLNSGEFSPSRKTSHSMVNPFGSSGSEPDICHGYRRSADRSGFSLFGVAFRESDAFKVHFS